MNLLNKLDEIAELKDGWLPDSIAISNETAEVIRYILENLTGTEMMPDDIGANSDGSIEIIWRKWGLYCDIHTNPHRFEFEHVMGSDRSWESKFEGEFHKGVSNDGDNSRDIIEIIRRYLESII
jgi:hypothetical protein